MRYMVIVFLIAVVIQPAFAVDEIILTSENLKSQAEVLKNIHERLGVSSEIVTIEDIWSAYQPAEHPPIGGYADSQKCREEVHGYNYTLARKIVSLLRSCNAEYVTILGDADVIPPSYYAEMLRIFPTDYFYADPDYDMHAEFAVGRIPVGNAEEAERVVNKIENWYSELNDFAKAVVVGEKVYPAWWDGEDYMGRKMEDVEVWQGEVISLNPPLDRFNYTLYFQSDGDRGKVKDILDDVFSGGYGLLYHDGHGTVFGIDYGGKMYTTLDLQKTKKDGLLPLVISDGCYVAAYDEELRNLFIPSNYPQQPFSEFLLVHDAGSIALVGFTSITATDYMFSINGGEVSVDEISGAAFITRHVAGLIGSGTSLGTAFKEAVNSYSSHFSLEPEHPGNNKDRFIYQMLLAAELIGDPTLELPRLERHNILAPEFTVETPVHEVRDSIPVYRGEVVLNFNETVTAKIFNLSARNVPIVLKYGGVSSLKLSGSGKYLLRISNGKKETWYVFYIEPGMSINYPRIVYAEVGEEIEIEINVTGSENAECELISAPSGATCNNLVFRWLPNKEGNYTVKFVIADENESRSGEFTIVVEPSIKVELVYPANCSTGVELDPTLKVRVIGNEDYKVQFYSGNELIGESDVENGTAVVKWNNLEAGREYSWYVVIKWSGGEKSFGTYKFRTSYPPEADFEYAVSNGTVLFRSTSSDIDGQSLSCRWDFGDSYAEGCEVMHIFEPGSHNVTLTVTDSTGLSDSITKNVVVSNSTLPLGSKDLDGDGLYEDINGDGVLNFDDVVYMRLHYREETFQNYVKYYDFNPDCKITSADVTRLYAYWKWNVKYWDKCKEYGWCTGCES